MFHKNGKCVFSKKMELNDHNVVTDVWQYSTANCLQYTGSEIYIHKLSYCTGCNTYNINNIHDHTNPSFLANIELQLPFKEMNDPYPTNIWIYIIMNVFEHAPPCITADYLR